MPPAPGLAALDVLSANQCACIYSGFEDDFSAPSGVWAQPPASQLAHCPAAGAVGAAGPESCTSMSPPLLNASLPGYPGGASGALFSLSQRPCFNPDGTNNPTCCSSGPGGVCASWAGARLQSFGCIRFGVLEIEAAMALPAAGGAVAFFGTYIVGGSPDPSWNEIDQAFYNTSSGMPVFSASMFLSPQPLNISTYLRNQGGVAGLASFYNSSATACLCSADQVAARTCFNLPQGYPTANATAAALGVGTVGGSCPLYTQQLASTYHNYKVPAPPSKLEIPFPATRNLRSLRYRADAAPRLVYLPHPAPPNQLVWTPTWIAWFIDSQLYRNTSAAVTGSATVPWRPMTVRLLLRTALGSAPVISGTLAGGAAFSVGAGSVFTSGGSGGPLYTNSLRNVTVTAATAASGQCSPCAIVTGAGPQALSSGAPASASIAYAPDSQLYVRRVKYTPLSAQSLVVAVTRQNSWTGGPVLATPPPVRHGGHHQSPNFVWRLCLPHPSIM